jgi:ABC-2 type transport system ATP-binding protein
MSLVEVSGLRKIYGGTPVVDDLTFHVERGEIFGLLGPNGAGKTTAMMILAGLRDADSGSVRIGDHDPAGAPLRRNRLLGLVPQELAIYPDLTGRENLSFFGAIYGLRGARLRERVACLLDETGLADHADQYVRTFSGGMKRRLNVGAGLLHEPQLVILDEPTVGVDPQSRSHLLEAVQRLASRGVAVIFATHYMDEAQAICHRVGIIDRGRMLRCGPPEELLDTLRSNVRLHVRLAARPGRQRLEDFADVEALVGNDVRLVVRRAPKDAPAAVMRRLATVFQRLSEAGADLVSIETSEHNLEDLFLELTGRNLRE